MDVYSTANVPPNTRARYWNDVYSSRFAQVTFNPVDSDEFEAELRVGAIGPLGIARVHSKPTDIERTRSHISRTCGRLFSFVLQAQGSGIFSHYGHETALEEGDFTLCDNAAPHRLNCKGWTELIILRASPDVLRPYLPYPEQVCGLRLRAGQGFADTAASMAHSLWNQVEQGLPEKFSAMIARNVLDVMATSYAVAFDECITDSSAAGARRTQARHFIEAHLRDPDLTPCAVAEALQISPRYLRMLFAGEREGVASYISRRRLEECARQIANVLWRGHTITEIAFAWGFNSAAHFTRVFREQYRMTPVQYRRARSSKSAPIAPPQIQSLQPNKHG